MLFLRFQIGEDAYVLDTARVAEVLPLVNLKRIPHAPTGIAGVFNYRGVPVPIVDLSELTLGRPAEHRLSTRVILVYFGEDGSRDRVLGLIAERATETVQRDPADFVPPGISSDAAPWLGAVATTQNGRLLQRIEIDKLLPARHASALFRRTEEGAWLTPQSKRS